jgi:hypothetical protein
VFGVRRKAKRGNEGRTGKEDRTNSPAYEKKSVDLGPQRLEYEYFASK